MVCSGTKPDIEIVVSQTVNTDKTGQESILHKV